MERGYFNWSSGKDSALALYFAQQAGCCHIETLFSVVNKGSGRISMHEVGEELLRRQAAALGIPLTVFDLDLTEDKAGYETRMAEQMEQFKKDDITTALFGDIYLEGIRKSREVKCRKAGMKAVFPLWGRKPEELLEEFIHAGFRSVVTSVDGEVLDESFLGRIIDRDFIADFPDGADICGENGEYHSFVFDGPIFKEPVAFEMGEKYFRDYSEKEPYHRYWYLTLR